MDREQIRTADMAAVEARRAEVRAEADRLLAFDRPTGAQRRRALELADEEEALRARQNELATADLAARHAAGGLVRESGDGWAGAPDHSAPAPGGRGGDARREAAALLARSRHLGDELPERVARVVEADETGRTAEVVLAAADPDYARAFARWARDPVNGHREFDTRELAAWRRARLASRSLNTTTGDAMVPTHLDPAIVLSSDGVQDPVRAIARVVTLGVGDTWHGVSSDGVTTRWAPEESPSPDASPTLSPPDVPTHKADAFVPISVEAFQDMLNVPDELRRLFADAKRNHEAPAFIAGSGTGQPTGAVSGLGAPQTVTTATLAVFADEDVYSLQNALPARFQGNASWLAALPVVNTVDQFETTNGAKKFPRVGAAEPVLLRKRLYEASEMSSATTTSGAHVLAYGDFRHYLIADRLGGTLEFIQHLFQQAVAGTGVATPTGQRGFYYYWRVGAAPIVANAFRRLAVQ